MCRIYSNTLCAAEDVTFDLNARDYAPLLQASHLLRVAACAVSLEGDGADADVDFIHLQPPTIDIQVRCNHCKQY